MSDDVLDLPEFLERVQDDKELLLELLDIFVADYQEKRKNLEEAIKANNAEEVTSIAHSLKGASGNISAKSLRESFMSLEEMGKNNDLSGADNELASVDQKFQAFSDRIVNIKDELK